MQAGSGSPRGPRRRLRAPTSSSSASGRRQEATAGPIFARSKRSPARSRSGSTATSSSLRRARSRPARPGGSRGRSDGSLVRNTSSMWPAIRNSFAREFRIAGHIELVLRTSEPSDRPRDPPGRAGRDRALLNDELVAVEPLRDRAGDLFDLAKIGPAVASWRRPDADEDDVGARNRLLGPRGEPDPACIQVGPEQFRQAWLVYGHQAL